LHLPSDVGVRVRVATSSGDIGAEGMKLESQDQSGSLYVNGAFGTSPITLQIDVQTSSGDVTLTLAN
jgi:predicted membrane protein